MVLAAGLGTRLRPLTDVLAKPLVPVGDRPALAHTLERIRAAGFERIVVNAHHRAEDIQHFARGLPFDVAVSEERELLGTAGGIAHASSLLGAGDVVVWNGDILADVDLRSLVAAHDAAATLVVQPLLRGDGPVGLDGMGNVVRLRQDVFGDEEHGGQFLGISVLSAALRARLPPQGGLIENLLVPALRRGAVVRSFPFDGSWTDIGTVESYRAANLAWLKERGLTHWVGSEAQIAAEISLHDSIVGAGARVEGSGVLARCVVWPGAKARAPAIDEVVTVS
jgi:mannose-1-phosphate guanylyltransferase